MPQWFRGIKIIGNVGQCSHLSLTMISAHAEPTTVQVTAGRGH